MTQINYIKYTIRSKKSSTPINTHNKNNYNEAGNNKNNKTGNKNLGNFQIIT